MKRRIVSLLCLGLAGLMSAQEPAPAPISDDAELARLRDNVDSLKADESSVLGQLSRLELASRIGQREAQLLDQQVGGLRAEAARQMAEADRLEAVMDADELAIRKIFLAAYRQRRRPPSGKGGDTVSLAVYRRYGGYIARLDQNRIIDHRGKVRELKLRRSRIQTQIRELKTVQEARGAKGRELAEVRGRYQLLLAAVSKQKKAYSEGLQAMEGAVRRLPTSGAPSGSNEGRGGWSPPVKAKVAAEFGYVIDPEYHTQLPHPGLDYNVADGTPVRAAAGGQVALAQFLEGYGETVILEHPDNYLSIYAHLRRPLVGLGQAVPAGQLVGLAGDTGSLRGPYLYFEVRKDGKPVNPVTLFTKSKAKSPPPRAQARQPKPRPNR